MSLARTEPMGRALRAPFFAVLPAVVLAVWPQFSTALQYDRLLISGGELWRIFTAHWVHWSVDHMVLDAVMVAVLWPFCRRYGRSRTWVAVLGTALAISAALWLLQPGLQTYRGLSGISVALFALLAISMAREQLRAGRPVQAMLPGLALLGLAAKIGFEICTRQTLFVDSAAAGFVPVPLAHAVGALVGACCVFFPSRTVLDSRRQQPRR